MAGRPRRARRANGDFPAAWNDLRVEAEDDRERERDHERILVLTRRRVA